MFKAFFAMLFLLCFGMGSVEQANAQPQPGDVTTIIVMRHAEKEAGKGSDPGLSAAGMQRAEKLVSLLKDVPVNHLLSTPYARTRQTLTALATARNLSIEPYEPAQQDALAAKLRSAAGETFVIAGHANTAPELVNLLLNDKRYTQLAEDEFGKVWILTLQSGKVVSCLLLNTN